MCCGDDVPADDEVESEDDFCDRPILDETIRELCATRERGVKTAEAKKQLSGGKVAQRECFRLLASRPRALTFNILGGEMVSPGDYPHMVSLEL